MTTTTTSSSFTTTAAARRALAGAGAGVAGGLVFGVLMQAMDMIGMVAQLVGSDSAVVGWAVHLAVSAFIGATYGVLLGALARTPALAAIAGLGWGIVWWVLGALLLMPLRLGMPVLELGTTAWQSLVGHLLYGLVLGLGVHVLLRRAVPRR